MGMLEKIISLHCLSELRALVIMAEGLFSRFSHSKLCIDIYYEPVSAVKIESN